MQTDQNNKRVVLDLFAGTGVGVAVKGLGGTEHGVELMKEALATRAANGMHTEFNDVWDAHLAEGFFDALTAEEKADWFTEWGSPPCQTFSMSGNGAGRKALDQVLGIIERKQYVNMDELREQSALLGDERIGLVLSPLHYAARFRPTHIALEQVPPVLPVWEAMVGELRELGYSAWAGILHSEQYGVPQTRKRAFLMARRDGVEVAPPTPTHSKFHSHDPGKLDEGVAKWVTIADALGLDVAADDAMTFVSNDKQAHSAVRSVHQPAPTITGGHDSANRVFISDTPRDGFHLHNGVYKRRVSVSDASLLQSYPADFQWEGAMTKQYLQIGNAVPPLMAKAVLEQLWSPNGPAVTDASA